MHAIKNPVLISNPWASNMPNNFRGSTAATTTKMSQPTNLKKPRQRATHTRKISKKLQLARNYADQLVPLYPFLAKYQVKAAIALANNNLHCTRLLLDLANKFLRISPLNLAVLNIHKKTTDEANVSNGSSSSNNTDVDKSNNTDESFTNVMFSDGLSSISSISDYKDSENQDGSFVKSEDLKSDIYEFSESDYNFEETQSWSSFKKQTTKRKIGVSIVKLQKGYKAFLL